MSPLARIFLVLLAVAVPPLLGLSLLVTFGSHVVERVGQGTTLLIVALATIGWAGAMSLVTARSLGKDIEALIGVAERGARDPVDASEAQRRIAAALDDRNRQLATLATQVRAVSITESASTVAHRIIAAVRDVTGNDTWSLAILRSADPIELPEGVFTPEGAVEPITELHRWAGVTSGADGGSSHIEGPWGAFVTVLIGEEALMNGVLFAPWEGRPEPSMADRDLLLLIGQHAALAVEHALLYARVRRQADELDRMAVIQRDFLRSVTHDLQTPLTSIRAVASELRASNPGQSASADLAIIEQQSDRLRRMVAQLLAVSRLEAGALQPQLDVVRVEPLVRRTWNALRSNRPFELTAFGEPHLAIADADRLEQALWAILDNAIKYSPDGARIEVTLRTRRADEAVLSLIEIRDHGVGMDGESRERAFEQFYRSTVARRMAPDGSGVGLYAAAGLIRLMHGTLSLESPSDGGTLVKITLPAETLSSDAS